MDFQMQTIFAKSFENIQTKLQQIIGERIS